MSEIRLVIFDMVGTTIEDAGQVTEAFLESLARNRIHASESEFVHWRGASKREVLRAFVERQYGAGNPANVRRINQAHADFQAALENAYARKRVRPIAGAEQTFAWLRQRDIRVALTTGFYRCVADMILQIVAWNAGLIDACICSDQVPMGRPAPYMIFRAMEATAVTDVRCVVKVGDTVLDLQAGSNAGAVGVVGVLTGSLRLEHLAGVEHTHVIDSVAELPRLWGTEGRFG